MRSFDSSLKIFKQRLKKTQRSRLRIERSLLPSVFYQAKPYCYQMGNLKKTQQRRLHIGWAYLTVHETKLRRTLFSTYFSALSASNLWHVKNLLPENEFLKKWRQKQRFAMKSNDLRKRKMTSSHESSLFIIRESVSDSNVPCAFSLVERRRGLISLLRLAWVRALEFDYVLYCVSLFLTFSSNIDDILDCCNTQLESVLY